LAELLALPRRWRYRTRQFVRGLRPRISAEEAAEARRLLSDGELRLFLAMTPRDRRQAFDVLRWLQHRGEPSEALQVAALLHDAGKGEIAVCDRIAFVLLEAISPRLVDALAARHGSRRRRPLWRLRHHARLGASRLERAGSDPRVLELVRGHCSDPGDDDELALLVSADGAS
jgi:hypothetical protein